MAIERFMRPPSALAKNMRTQRLGPTGAPVMLVHPDWDSGRRVPIVLWMHGRTVSKEIDPGRYLRLMRADGGGIGVCAIDLPGHGERYDDRLQQPAHTFEVIEQMIEEIDLIVDALRPFDAFNLDRIGIGGMSAGGMATLARLCRPHRFVCASVEATSGSWAHQQDRPMFEKISQSRVDALDPMKSLDEWREIPLQAFHTKADQWVDFDGQATFIDAVRQRYADPDLVDFVTYDKTGAPQEHAGFGRFAADAKNRQTAFFQRWLQQWTPADSE